MTTINPHQLTVLCGECDLCGALIGNAKQHARWHRVIEDQLQVERDRATDAWGDRDALQLRQATREASS